MRALILAFALAVPACRHESAAKPTPVVQRGTPLPRYEPVVFTTGAKACGELDIHIVAAQWPEPQWVGAEPPLLGGGWTSISTGRFGSASWEHCETLGFVGDHTVELLSPDSAYGGMLFDGQACRVPDGVLPNGEFYDFGTFRLTVASRSREDAMEAAGWAPAWQWEEFFTFYELQIYSIEDRAWTSAKWPQQGMYNGWSAAKLPNGDLLLAGGARELSEGRRQPVAQAARFVAEDRTWRYVDAGPVVEEPLKVPWPSGALVFGRDSASHFDATSEVWTTLPVPPPFERPKALRVGDAVLFADEDGEAAWYSVDEGTRPLAPIAGRVVDLLVVDDQVFAVTSEELLRLDGQAWLSCQVDRKFDAYPVRGKGEGTFGPALVTARGHVWLTRIDRNRNYDYE